MDTRATLHSGVYQSLAGESAAPSHRPLPAEAGAGQAPEMPQVVGVGLLALELQEAFDAVPIWEADIET